MMKKFLFFVCSIVFSVSLLNAQSITTNSNVPLESLIGDTLVNGCIQVSNITANNGAKGYFRKGDSQFPFNSGIILATGSISNAQGPNSSGSAGNSVGSGSDPDLQALIPSYTINDASVIQFDFIPAENVVTFRYIFGSEEFPEYANTSFNDVFGFFLSGPGINGPYSNNAINIALLPNNQPVTINNVHNFNYYTAYPTSASNSPGSYYGAVQYDGNTIVLTATATVVACETYHIKLAIGDAGDSNYDSGVFIEAGSFISGESITISNIAQVGSEADLWEGCTNYYVVSREEGSDAQQDLLISVGIAPNSTATEGVDFSPFPTTVFIPAGQMTDTIWYTAYNDGIEEGHETIIVMFYTACPCGNYSTAIYDTIWIYDAEFIKGGIQDITTHYCGQDPPATITLVGECNIDPHVGYYWSTGATTNSIQITPQPGATTYYVTMVDQCGNQVYDSITIRISDLRINSYDVTEPSCFNACNGTITLNVSSEFQPIHYRYVHSLYQYIPDSVRTSYSSTFTGLCPGTYKITATDNIGCFQRFEIAIPNPPSIELAYGILEPDQEYCERPESISFTAESNQNNPQFLWSNNQTGATMTLQNPPVGEHTYWVKMFDGCGNFKQDFVTVKISDITIQTQSVMDMGTCNGSAAAFASNGFYPYNYYWYQPINGFGNMFTNLCAGTYQVLVTDAINCQRTTTVDVPLYNNNSVNQTLHDNIFTVFPNPTNGSFILNFKENNPNEIIVKITDIKGNLIFESQLLSNQTTFDNFVPGVYFISLYKNDGIYAIQKLVVTE